MTNQASEDCTYPKKVHDRALIFDTIWWLSDILESYSGDLTSTLRSGKKYHAFITNMLRQLLARPELLDRFIQEETLDLYINEETGEITIK